VGEVIYEFSPTLDDDFSFFDRILPFGVFEEYESPDGRLNGSGGAAVAGPGRAGLLARVLMRVTVFGGVGKADILIDRLTVCSGIAMDALLNTLGFKVGMDGDELVCWSFGGEGGG
jgi:hypothetical protein